MSISTVLAQSAILTPIGEDQNYIIEKKILFSVHLFSQ